MNMSRRGALVTAMVMVMGLVACGGGAQRTPAVGGAGAQSTPAAGGAGTPAADPSAPAAHAAPAAPAAPEPPKLRLGDNAAPRQAAIELTIDPNKPTFDGVVDIDLELNAATYILWLNGAEIAIQSATLSTPGGAAAVPAHVVPVAPGGDFVGFSFDRPVGPGTGRLRISYSGKVSDKESQGIFRQKDGDEWYAFTQFESTDARRAFPCFDEPGFKIPWQVTLHVPRELTALSNTPVASEKEEAGGMKAVAFAPTKPLPSYLVAFGVGRFDVVDAGRAKSGAPVRIVAPKGHAGQATYAVEVSAQILSALEDYFGTPYPFEKMDLLFIPQTVAFGAMENPGLVTFVERSLLSKPNEDSLQRQRGFAHTAAHEFAHQWFGDLVTLAWWNDAWLNEAFATWMASKTMQRLQPTWGDDVARVRSRSRALGMDALTTARAVRQPIESKNDIINAFDGITYSKGGAVLEMFESYLGEDRFREGVRQYLAAHARKNATADDFIAAMSAVAGADLKPGFSSFLDQPGAPLVTAELRCDKGQPPRVELAQRRFLPSGSTGTAEAQWHIPVCVKYLVGKTEGRECTVLTTVQGELSLPAAKGCPDLVLPNAGERGYYRVVYQGDTLRKLIKDGGKRLTLPERVGLVGDARALVANGSVRYGDALQLVAPLLADGNRYTIDEAIGLVAGLRANLVPPELLPNYQRLVRKTFGAKAHELGFRPRGRDEDDDTRLLRESLVPFVAVNGEDRELLAEARTLAARWLDDHGAVAPELVAGVLRAAAHTGDRALYERYREAAKRADDEKTRAIIVGGMGWFRDRDLVERNLQLTLGDELDIRHSMGLFMGALAWERTRQLAYDFVKQHFDALTARMPRQAHAALIRIGGAFCDAEHRADVEAFFKDKAPHILGGPRVLANVLEQTSLCIANVRLSQPSVTAFLQKY
jgi:aminopeptidase N